MKNSICRRTLIRSSVTVAVAVILTACSTTPIAPAWVLNPSATNGLAAAECVPSSGQISIDRDQAVALARTQLAQQLEVRIESMAKTYAAKRGLGSDAQLVSKFTSVSKQSVDKTLNGVKVEKVEEFKGRNGRELCVLLNLPETQARELVRVVSTAAAGGDAAVQDQEALYEAFRSAQTSS